MPHPLAIKYGAGDPKAWDEEKRAQARDELHAVLGAGREGKKRLKGEDRIELMRIWLSVIAAEHGTDKGTQTAAVNGKARPAKKNFKLSLPPIPGWAFIVGIAKTMTFADFAFVIFLCGMTTAVFSLGFHAVREVLRMEDVKKDAEELVQWFKSTADDRKNPDFKPAACQKSETQVWKNCLAALVAEGGPLHNKINAFEPDRGLTSRKCDQQDTETIGTIIVEKGAIPVGGSSYSYTPFDGTETLNKDFTLRVLVCGRGFHLIKVQNELSW